MDEPNNVKFCKVYEKVLSEFIYEKVLSESIL